MKLKKIVSSSFSVTFRNLLKALSIVNFLMYLQNHLDKDYLKSTSGCSSKILSRLICSSHKLRIESGRWMKPKVERDEIFQELADFCLTNSVENEIHLLCECSFFGDLRNRVFGSGLKIDPNVLPSLFNDPKLIRKTCRFLQAANNISKMKKG